MKTLFNRSAAALAAAGLIWGSADRGQAQGPGTPAAPLAGGYAAANGGAFMNVQGESIVMPASYHQGAYGGCEPGYGEMCLDGSGCYGGGGGYADQGYADFGGASYPDQCGPHYFDFSVQGVALTSEDLFQDVPALGSIGVAGPLILDPATALDDYEAGWQIAARLDFGPLSVLEATYMGIYDMGYSQQVVSTEVANGVNFQLNTVFSDYGINPIDGLDQAAVLNQDYQSDLQSTELTYRRYWVGYNPRVSGTYLAGFRYIRMTEDMVFSSVALLGDSSLDWSTDNDLVGAQLGGDGWISLRQGLRIGGEAKAGIYNNRFKYRHATAIPDPRITNVDFETDGNQVAFAGEASLDLVADILPSVSIRGGYQALVMTSLVTVGNNIDPNDVTSTNVFTQADALYHGFRGGIEYIW